VSNTQVSEKITKYFEALNEELDACSMDVSPPEVKTDDLDDSRNAYYFQRGYMDGLTFALKLFAKFNWERELKDDT
jgi:hypothetical protein